MNTSKTFLFAGASSAIAKETAKLLQEQGHQVIGISTKPSQFDYNEFYEVDSYAFGGFPALETAIDGLVYFPGTINLKPFCPPYSSRIFKGFRNKLSWGGGLCAGLFA
jgi:3-oxoacyl-[acyl-carrier protein] reductase